jgi:putative aldouronate transport system permease protein
MNAIIYLQDPEMHPIQVVLHRLLVLSQTRESEQSSLTYYLDQKAGVATIKHAVTIMAILPIIMVYPFLQKYFVKGIIIGAIKQ